jgi:hypothetical protein
MSLRARIKHLEKSSAAASCPGCAARRITSHEEYELPNGESITLPPFPDLPRCTCKNRERKISFIVVKHPGQVASREEAERRYAKYAAFHRPWQPDGEG